MLTNTNTPNVSTFYFRNAGKRRCRNLGANMHYWNAGRDVTNSEQLRFFDFSDIYSHHYDFLKCDEFYFPKLQQLNSQNPGKYNFPKSSKYTFRDEVGVGPGSFYCSLTLGQTKRGGRERVGAGNGTNILLQDDRLIPLYGPTVVLLGVVLGIAWCSSWYCSG